MGGVGSVTAAAQPALATAAAASAPAFRVDTVDTVAGEDAPAIQVPEPNGLAAESPQRATASGAIPPPTVAERTATASDQAPATVDIEPACENGLDDWTVVEDGGTSGARGGASDATGDLVLREGDSFLVALEQTIIVPDNAGHLSFEFSSLAFDSSARGSINDAFEVALVDAAGLSVVPTIGANRDAFFNITDDQQPLLGAATTATDERISLDLSGLAAGSTPKLIIRLVNNDADRDSTVTIVCEGHNEPPVVSAAGVSGDEGQAVQLSAHFTDAGDDGAHTAVIDWGDGSSGPAIVAAADPDGRRTLAASHVYADNGTYPIKVTVTDADGAVGEGSAAATIGNVAPDLSAGFRFTSHATATGNQLVTEVSGDFTDPGFTSPAAGTVETFTTTIDWGDGQTETLTHTLTPGGAGVATAGAFTATHQYTAAGLYEVTVRVVDDDGGSDAVALRYGIMRIDVVPTINIPEKGVIPVKILSAPGFSPRDLDPASMRFGPGGASESHGQIHGGGVTHFPAPASAIRPSDTVAFLVARHLDGTVFVGMDTIRLTPSSTRPGKGAKADSGVGVITNLPPAKFFVADPGADRVYRYDPAGGAVGAYAADAPARNILGIAANAAGDTLWTIDGTTHLVSVQGPSGEFLGAWQATGLRSPTGIASDGTDVWVVDAGTRQIVRFAGAASLRGGVAAGTPGMTFDLHADNINPSDVVTNGSHVWVTDDAKDTVFVYDLSGAHQGNWQLDARNADAAGLTLNPAGGESNLWVVDRVDKVVYLYSQGLDRRAGQQAAATEFVLVSANSNPEAIADPPQQIALPDFADLSGWSLNGSAAAINAAGPVVVDGKAVLRLTNGLGQSASAFVSEPIPLQQETFDASFSTAFAFRISNPLGIGDSDGQGADGITFTIQTVANNVGGAGGGIGYAGIPRSVAVEFDTFDNGEISGNHVGINVNGDIRSVAVRPFATRFNDGQVYFAWVDYNGQTDQLEVRVSADSTRPAAPFLTHTIDLPSVLQVPAALVGFTSGTAAGGGTHDIRSLAFINDFNPIGEFGVSVEASTGADSFRAGTSALVSGNAVSTNESGQRRRINSVTIDGTQVEVLDAGGNFFAHITVASGETQLDVVATDDLGQSASTSLKITGVQSVAGAIIGHELVDVTASIAAEYRQTSFNEATDILYAGIHIKNTGNYPIDQPLLVGVKNISDPGVRVRQFDGRTADGIPYYDMSHLLDVGTLSPGELTDVGTIAFYNPDHIRFTYELVLLGQLNQPPQFTSLPMVEATAGRDYAYDADARDPNHDDLAYELLAGPGGMTIDAASGALAFAPDGDDIGNHDVRVRTSDGRGGSAIQRFTLSVTDALPNRPPVFTSLPVVSGVFNQEYDYDSNAADPDGDVLAYEVVSGPAGMAIDPATGVVKWTPGATQGGQSGVMLRVTDGRGGAATQVYPILVAGDASNGPPVIISDPVTHVALATGPTPTAQPVNLAAWTEVQYELNSQADANWEIDTATNVARQSVNADASILVSDFDLSDTKIQGTWRMEPAGDDDFVGFVFGYQDPQHYYLFDWKAGTQPDAIGLAEAGMTLKVVNASTGLAGTDLWPTTGQPERVTPLFHNTIPWQFGVDYRFTLEFHAGRFTISVHQGDALLESFTLNDSTYTTGKFGFYNYSQGPVRYSGFRTTELPPVGKYVYDVDAIDPNDDDLTYSLTTKPDGMTIDADTGVIEWNVSPSNTPPESTVYFGEDVNLTEDPSTPADDPVRPASLPQSDTASARFLDRLRDARVESFESIAVNTTPIQLTFASDVVTLSGSAVVRNVPTGTFNGTYPTDGDQFLFHFGSTGQFTLQFSSPQAAFGFRATDVGDGDAQLIVTLTRADGSTATHTVPTGEPHSGSALFWGVLDTADPFTKVTFTNTNSALDGFGFDEMVIGRAAQVLPAPAPVVVRVEDGKGGFDQQSFVIEIVDGALGEIRGTKFNDLNGDGVRQITPPLTTQILGPSAYLSRNDSQFDLSGLGTTFFIEDFEDHLLNTPGVTKDLGGVTSVVFGPGIHDSVDADDGVIDGSGLNGDSFFANGRPGIRFTFSAAALGGQLPTHAGIVWTDGGGGALVRFEAFDADGNSIGVRTGTHADGSNNGETAEDRFYGATHPGGISAIHISNIGGGIEVDHLQYGRPTPGGSTLVEPGLPDVVVYVDANRNLRRDADELFTRTDADGHYAFTALPPGTYVVREEIPPPAAGHTRPWRQTAPLSGQHVITPTPGELFTGADFGNMQVDGDNAAPQFTSDPPQDASAGATLLYRSAVVDPDLDPLMFDLPVKPQGMVIDPLSGVLAWVPTAAQVGQHEVVLRVSDGRGGIALQPFTVVVAAANAAPVIISKSTDTAVVGQPFVYDVRALDPDGDAVEFSLGSGAPAGVAIDADSGLLTWTPTAAQAGRRAITVIATDARGAQGSQTFNLDVAAAPPNLPPNIDSNPRTRIQVGQNYLYRVTISDPDGDPTTYQLLDAPTGMQIDPDGLVTWVPSPAHVEQTNDVRILVSDGRGGTDQQTFAVDVTTNVVNGAPIIISTPPATATAETLLRYDARATDPDNDVLFWSLEAGPDGMAIDQQIGILIWTPRANQLGTATATIRVTDASGASDLQQFDITVFAVNIPPLISSTPNTNATVNVAYTYAVRASDLNGDTLTYELTQAPAGMTIDDATGVIRWTPQPAQVGPAGVSVVVSDGNGGFDSQSFEILVNAGANKPPVITSEAPTDAEQGVAYTYQVLASDPESTPLNYSLDEAPLGMTIDPATGLISFTPQVSDGGLRGVTVRVRDIGGASAAQSYILNVRANEPPVPQGSPLLRVAAGQLYRSDLKVTDPDGDPLRYTLDVGPAGFAVDPLGRMTWQTALADVGAHPVVITVSDGRGREIELAFDVQVIADAQAPRVTLQLSAPKVNVGQSISLTALATDDVAVESLRVTVNGERIALDDRGRATVPVNTAGLVDFVATATDTAGNTAAATRTLQVVDPSDVQAPVVALNSPAQDAVITTFADVIGTAADDNLARYTLSIAPADTGQFTEIARGETSVTDGLLGTFDPTRLTNDVYTLRLAAFDDGGNVSIVDRDISVRGNLKLGEFSVSFVDVSVPVIGVPILVSRTYSSFESSRDGQLGFGWSLDVQDTKLRTNVPLSGGEEDGFYNPFFQNARVYVTLPGGKREGFTFQPRLRLSLFDMQLFRPEFVPDPGVTSTLTVGQFDLTRASTGEFFGMATGGLAYNPADSAFGDNYRLTTKEGLAYTVDGDSGKIETVADPDGNTLTYTNAGITSSSGLSVTFERDLRGRITGVTDPSGKSVRYAYDARSDLVAVTDRAGNITKFEYNAARSHFLDKIIDPLGRTGARVEYDAEGRISRVFDADGNEIQFINDIANSRQTIVDQRGNETIHEYNDRGNVLTTIDPNDGITRRTYDVNDYELTTTDPLGHVTTRTFDARGNLLSESDDLGNTIRATYNGFAQVLASTDPLGHTTTNEYTKGGDLRFVQLPDGSFFSGVKASDGNFVHVTDAFGTTRMDLDGAGRVVREVDALGNEQRYTYNANGDVLTHTVFRTIDGELQALTTTYGYDSENRVTSVRDALDNISRTEYDALGNVTARTDARQKRTEYEYDARRLLTKTLHPDGTTEFFEYDAAGNKIKYVNQRGLATHYEYDKLNRLVATIHSDDTPADLTNNPRNRNVYDLAGRLTATIDENGNRTDYEYDDADRRIRTILPEVVNGATGTPTRPVVRAEYDAAGNQTVMIDPLGRRTEFQYDALGRVTLTRYADGTTTRQQYDSAGRIIAKIDQAGETTAYSYDAVGNLLSVALPAPTAGQSPLVTQYTYDESGRVLTETDALGHTTHLSYDQLNRLTRRQRPSGVSESFAHDAADNLIRHTDFNNVTTELEYDDMNRLVRKEYPDGTFAGWSYTPTGQVLTTTDPRGVSQLVYDERDRLLSRTEPDSRAISYTYDAADNRLSVTTPAGISRYDYDALNRMVKVTDPANGVTEYAYDLVDNPLRISFANGTIEQRTYDPLDRTMSVRHSNAGGIFESFEYTFDAVGRRASVVEHSGRRVSYTYDLTGRLTGEAIDEPAGADRSIGYTYDAVGNRLTRNDSAVGQTAHTYDINDRLITESTGGNAITYAYDNNGNTLSRTGGGETVFYIYDAENRLTAADITTGGGTTEIDYRYNADGLLVSRTLNGQETRFLLDTQLPYAEVMEEYSPAGTTLTSYVYGLDLLSQTLGGGATSFFHTDALGSTRALTSAAGAVTDRYTYDAYGETLAQTGSTANSHLYRGEVFDGNADLYYLRARYLDPSVGRFLTTDPFAGNRADPVTLHRYLYANADPMNVSDPSGRIGIAEFLFGKNLENNLRATALNVGRNIENIIGHGVARAFARHGVRASFQALQTTNRARLRTELTNVLTNYLRTVRSAKVRKLMGEFLRRESAELIAQGGESRILGELLRGAINQIPRHLIGAL